MENSMKFSQKNTNKTALWWRNSTSGYFSEESEDTNLDRYKHSVEGHQGWTVPTKLRRHVKAGKKNTAPYHQWVT